ncbi:MAG: diaminopimelate epimerase [Gammaproteobacteria bacterium]
MKIHFRKMHGLGNDFVVIDATHKPHYLTPEKIRLMADRHRGIGFDQLLLIEPSEFPEADFFYRIFNADGSESEQCGNGIRCVARFIHEKKLSDKKILFVATKKNLHELILLDDGLVRANMQIPEFKPEKIPFVSTECKEMYTINSPEGIINFMPLSVGNPHAVIEVSDINTVDVEKIGEFISFHPSFPEKTNVEFMQILSPSAIKLRVYERGTGETQACGSGACAAVVAGRMLKKLDEHIHVQLPGGELRISWQGEDTPVWMIGPAASVFEGVIELE